MYPEMAKAGSVQPLSGPLEDCSGPATSFLTGYISQPSVTGNPPRDEAPESRRKSRRLPGYRLDRVGLKRRVGSGGLPDTLRA